MLDLIRCADVLDIIAIADVRFAAVINLPFILSYRPRNQQLCIWIEPLHRAPCCDPAQSASGTVVHKPR
jgi:hypothetical protein